MIIKEARQFIFQSNPAAPSCHASTVLPLDDGTVLSAWFAGAKEGAEDVGIWFARRSTDGVWSNPELIEDDRDIPHWNPVLDRRNDSSIRLYFKSGRKIAYWITKYCDSFDGGKTWTPVKELVENDVTGGRGPVKNKCLRISDGTLLAPSSSEQNKQFRPFIDISHDDGDTWERCKYITRPMTPTGVCQMIQPTLWEAPEGHIHALLRSNKGRIYRTDSNNYGRTWSRAYPTELPNNNSGIDCVKTGDGKIWLVYNPVSDNWGERSPLRLSVSEDNGDTWITAKDLETDTTPDNEFSYPAITARGKKLFITYTYQREKIAYWEIEYK